jgi:glycosyltransferase involved in cell wall biosynthesis
MKIMLVTDAWHLQVNGVVHTWSYITNLIRKDYEITVLNPYIEGSEHLPLKLQGNIPILKNASQVVDKFYDEQLPDRVHIETEWSLGLAMRQFCIKNKINYYNTSYHTRLADYGWVLYGVPTFLTWLYVRWFHKCSRKFLVTTKSIAKQLGLSNCIVWGRGVDTGLFNPRSREELLRG